MGYLLDRSAWPIAHFRFIGRLTEADVVRYFEDSNEVVNGTERYVCVMDGTEMLMPEADIVRRQAAWMKENRAAMLRVNMGVAFVMPSALVRGLVKAVTYFQEIPVPSASFETFDQARTWAERRLAVSLRPPVG